MSTTETRLTEAEIVARVPDAELAARLTDIVGRVFSPGPHARRDRVTDLCKLLTAVSIRDYAVLRLSLLGEEAPDDAWGGMSPLPTRLERLAIRLEQDGLYVDAGIVASAAATLTKEPT